MTFLTLDSPAVALSNAAFGQGVDPIWLDEVACSGQEALLTECPRDPFGVNDCSHREDAGVDCGAPPVPTAEVTTEAETTMATTVTTTQAETTMATTEVEITMATTEAPTTMQPPQGTL